MKTMIRKWLGISDLRSRVDEIERRIPTSTDRINTAARAEFENRVDESYQILGALCDYLGVYPYKDWVNDPQYVPDSPRMKQVIKVKPNRTEPIYGGMNPRRNKKPLTDL